MAKKKKNGSTSPKAVNAEVEPAVDAGDTDVPTEDLTDTQVAEAKVIAQLTAIEEAKKSLEEKTKAQGVAGARAFITNVAVSYPAKDVLAWARQIHMLGDGSVDSPRIVSMFDLLLAVARSEERQVNLGICNPDNDEFLRKSIVAGAPGQDGGYLLDEEIKGFEHDLGHMATVEEGVDKSEYAAKQANFVRAWRARVIDAPLNVKHMEDIHAALRKEAAQGNATVVEEVDQVVKTRDSVSLSRDFILLEHFDKDKMAEAVAALINQMGTLTRSVARLSGETPEQLTKVDEPVSDIPIEEVKPAEGRPS